MEVRPFRALRPRADLAARVASPPYDVPSPEEARCEAAANPLSFLRVIRAEVDLDPGVDPHDAAVRERAARNLREMVARGVLVRDAVPAYWAYRLVMRTRAQTGIVGAAAVADYLEGRIKRHEHTRPDKEEDRVRLNDALGAHPGPVFMAYRDDRALIEATARAASGQPTVRFRAADGVEHLLWAVDEPVLVAEIASAFRGIDRTYVADGHHRAAAAAKVGELRLRRSPKLLPGAPPRFFMAAHFPAAELRVLDYNRVARGLGGRSARELVGRIVEAGFRVAEGWTARRPDAPGSFGMYLAGAWYRLEASPAMRAIEDPVRRLDVAILTERLLEPLFGVGDPRTDPRLEFVGGIRGMDELERKVDAAGDALAFALFPPSLEQVFAVADSGRVMPPKSTWFEPKLRSGLVVQSLDGDAL